MPLQLFTPDMATPPTRPLRVTVRPDYRLSFNAETSRALQTAGIRCVRIFGDRTTKQVVIRPAPHDAPDGHLITYVKPSPYQIRASLEAAPFLRWLGYVPQPSTRYLVSNLPRRAFTFSLLATPTSTTKDTNNQ
jgi:hypothetical protein